MSNDRRVGIAAEKYVVQPSIQAALIPPAWGKLTAARRDTSGPNEGHDIFYTTDCLPWKNPLEVKAADKGSYHRYTGCLPIEQVQVDWHTAGYWPKMQRPELYPAENVMTPDALIFVLAEDVQQGSVYAVVLVTFDELSSMLGCGREACPQYAQCPHRCPLMQRNSIPGTWLYRQTKEQHAENPKQILRNVYLTEIVKRCPSTRIQTCGERPAANNAEEHVRLDLLANQADAIGCNGWRDKG